MSETRSWSTATDTTETASPCSSDSSNTQQQQVIAQTDTLTIAGLQQDLLLRAKLNQYECELRMMQQQIAILTNHNKILTDQVAQRDAQLSGFYSNSTYLHLFSNYMRALEKMCALQKQTDADKKTIETLLSENATLKMTLSSSDATTSWEQTPDSSAASSTLSSHSFLTQAPFVNSLLAAEPLLRQTSPAYDRSMDDVRQLSASSQQKPNTRTALDVLSFLAPGAKEPADDEIVQADSFLIFE